MVSTNGKTTRKKAKVVEVVEDFNLDIDPELMEPGYNQIRRPQLPYGIVINDSPAGIIIPVDQLEKAGWLRMPDEEELTTVEFTEDVTGLLIQNARMLVLGAVPEYIRYKADVEDLAGTMVGLYEDHKSQLDKKTMEVCCEHALVFLDENNRPLHSIAIVVRFKNVALWSFKAAREEYYRQLEKAFADYCEVPYSGKNDKWRSLGVLEVEFKAVKEGEGKNKHFCCKTVSITKPTAENFPTLFLGSPELKGRIWGLHDEIAGFNESTVPALPPAKEPLIEVLPPASKGSQEPKSVTAKRQNRQAKVVELVEDDDFEIEDEETELNVDEEENEAEDDDDLDFDDEDESD